MKVEVFSNADRMRKISELLQARGIKPVGDPGFYAYVFQSKNSGEVIKIFEKDDCYSNFVKLVHDQPSMSFPRIRKYAKFSQGIFKGLYILKLEKLNPLPELFWDKFVNAYVDYRNLKAKPHNYIPKDAIKIKQMGENALKQQPDLCKAIDICFEHLPNKCRIDLHINNVMRRADNTMVIIDPYF